MLDATNEPRPFFLSVPESDEDGERRARLRALLQQHLGQPPAERDGKLFSFGGVGDGSSTVEKGRGFLARLAPAGLAAPHWPMEHGGAGLPAADAAILAEELGRFDVPSLYAFMVGLAQVGPAIIRYANDEQKARWLPRILSGEDIWCQFFSEPEAGSDLASLRTSARRDETTGDWIIDGQKVWTSRANYADLGFLLARTAPISHGRHAGLTVFVIAMDQDGVQPRPLRQMNGDAQFSEVFFKGARVRDADRIGDVGEGWAVAIETLTHERAGAGSAMAGLGSRSVVEELRRNGALDTPAGRRRAIDVVIGLELSRLTSLRLRQGPPGPIASMGKLIGGRAVKEAITALFDSLGAEALLANNFWCNEFLTAPSLGIRGGTNEIVRNILGERVLGLPRDPRPPPAAETA